MKKPLRQDDAFLADVETARIELTALHVWWLGQSGFLVQWQGRHLLLDPYLSDSLTTKYAGTDKPHVRLSERVVAPERLGFVDVVTSSHNHTDHLDPDTLRPLARANPRLHLVCARANVPLAGERSGLSAGQIIGLDPEEEPRLIDLGPFQIEAVPAAHEGLDRDAAGRFQYVGFVVRAGPWTLYHSGDTVWYDGMAEHLAAYHVQLALLPINGRAPERRVAGNLSRLEAARLGREIGAGLVVPCHYDLFAFNTATPDDFLAECARLSQPCRVLEQGERLTLKS
jgi:L-ascorbate metabolism protein UlaG (beta-lactamase superfamily)